MRQVYQCWWRICREIYVFSRFQYHMFYVLYPFVTYLLTLPRIYIVVLQRVTVRRTFTHSFTHGAEPFLRSCQLCSHSRNSQHFMEPENSLPCLQEPSTGSYPEPDQSIHPIPSHLSKRRTLTHKVIMKVVKLTCLRYHVHIIYNLDNVITLLSFTNTLCR
jgi:hypothetical protein